MADEVDQGNALAEHSLARAIASHRDADRLPRVGFCHNCDEPVPIDGLFCDSDCSDDWHARQRAARRQGAAS